MNGEKLTPITNKPSLWALSPLLVFLCLYLVTSIIVDDFYKVPITVAFMASSVYAVCIPKGLSLNERMLQYSIGAANKNIMLMIWIFILAGAFAQSAKDIGAIDATVNLTLLLLPDHLLLAGIFLAACFISLSIGTSVGTIVALVPVVAGIADKTDMNLAFIVLFNPFGTMEALTILIGLSLVYDGISDLVLIHRLSRAFREAERRGDVIETEGWSRDDE